MNNLGLFYKDHRQFISGYVYLYTEDFATNRDVKIRFILYNRIIFNYYLAIKKAGGIN